MSSPTLQARFGQTSLQTALPHPSPSSLFAVAVHDHDVVVEVVELRLDRVDELRDRQGELGLALRHGLSPHDDEQEVDLPLAADRRAVAEVRHGAEIAGWLGRRVGAAAPEPLSSAVVVPELLELEDEALDEPSGTVVTGVVVNADESEVGA
jgi:hypothetical protein